MITIDRERRDATGAPIYPRETWSERAREATDTALREGRHHEAERSVYADDGVRAALIELFHRNCAYCGGRIADADWDVEHFRPKGRVYERAEHPGYYWLTYEWGNLYAACPSCNRRRRDKPTWHDTTTGPAAGKSDQFPLADESTRAMTPNANLSAEARLLIDPCHDEPENYLGYEPTGRIFAIGDAPMGKTSVAVFALFRKTLVEERREAWDDAVKLLCVIRRAEQAGVVDVAESLRKEFRHRSEQGPYAGVVRFVENNRDVFLE